MRIKGKDYYFLISLSLLLHSEVLERITVSIHSRLINATMSDREAFKKAAID